MDEATQYFNRQAAGYMAASMRWPWRSLRRAEACAVMNMARPVTGTEVLELGCGVGYYTRALLDAGAGQVWAVDRSAEMLRQLPRERVTAVQGDIADVRVGRTFAGVLAAGVFEFVDPARVLANAAAHASAGAWLVVLYSRPSVAGALFRAFHRTHGIAVRLYSWEQFNDAAVAAGWRVEEWRTCGLFCIAARFRLAPGARLERDAGA